MKKAVRIVLSAGLFTAGFLCLFFTVYPLLTAETTLYEIVKQYSYFTDEVIVLTGIYFMLAALAFFGVKKLEGFVFNPYVKTGITVYMLSVGIIYYLGVVPFSIVGRTEGFFLGEPQSVYMHAVVPVVTAALYLLSPFNGPVSVKRSLYLLIYPLVYVAYLFAYTAATGEALYPFFDRTIVSGPLVSVACIAAAAVGVCLIGLAIIKVFNRRYASAERKRAGREA